MDTIWTRGMSPTEYPALVGDTQTDVLVIGGGMAGILIARELSSRGILCAVVEAGRIGMGVTSGTTAVVSAQHSTLYSRLLDDLGRDRAKAYLDANLETVEEIARTAQGVDCDFERRPSVIYSTRDKEKLIREAETVKSLGFPACFSRDFPANTGAVGAVIFPDMAQFHPLKYLYGMASGLTIYENSVVRRVKDMTAYTDGGSVRAKTIVIASHFPFLDRRGLYFMKMHQTRESVVAVEGGPEIGYTAVEDEEKGFFLRGYGKLLLVGCGNHLPGEENDDFARIGLFLEKFAPGSRQVCRWVNQDCVTLDGVPYIGRYSPALPHIFVATGFNAWGMSTSMAAAKIIAGAITGQESRFAKVFVPNRPMRAAPLLQNAGRSGVNLLTPTLPRCTHLGCALKYNASAHTWDCPCHGSRFREDGGVLTGPAVKKAKIK